MFNKINVTQWLMKVFIRLWHSNLVHDNFNIGWKYINPASCRQMSIKFYVWPWRWSLYSQKFFVRFNLLSLVGFHLHLWFWNGSQTCTNCTNQFCQVETQYFDWFSTVLRQKYVLIASINVSVIYNSSWLLSAVYCLFLLI